TTKRRGVRTDECLTLISRLWKEDSVSFDGEFFQYRDVSISPRPVQPDIPMWVGGSAEGAIRRTAALGTGWQAGLETPAQVAPVIAGIKRALTQTGRTIDQDHYGAGFAYRFGTWDDAPVARNMAALAKRVKDDPRGYYAVGGADEILARLREFIEAGAHKFILRPVAGDAHEMVEQTRLLIAEVIPQVAAMNS
ncbi:MAG: LLM class flavin-dependent oxidoreductase, partial [Alphaproteobacteria bacterium]|nr:LLM class flavin-dependent oxidoreductase [Alphaproteobacteria bacterium]